MCKTTAFIKEAQFSENIIIYWTLKIIMERCIRYNKVMLLNRYKKYLPFKLIAFLFTLSYVFIEKYLALKMAYSL